MKYYLNFLIVFFLLIPIEVLSATSRGVNFYVYRSLERQNAIQADDDNKNSHRFLKPIENIRQNVYHLLGQDEKSSDKVSELLLKALSSREVSKHLQAIRSVRLFKLNYSSVLKELRNLFYTSELKVQEEIYFTFQEIGAVLFDQFDDPSSAIRKKALENFIEEHSRYQKFALYFLVDLASSDSDPEVRKLALLKLNHYVTNFMKVIEDQVLVEKILRSRLLYNKSSLIRGLTLNILSYATIFSGVFCSNVCVRVSEFLSDYSPQVRMVAAHALSRLKPRDSQIYWVLVDVITRELNPQVQSVALDALAEFEVSYSVSIKKLTNEISTNAFHTSDVRLKFIKTVRKLLKKKLDRTLTKADISFISNRLVTKGLIDENPLIRLETLLTLKDLKVDNPIILKHIRNIVHSDSDARVRDVAKKFRNQVDFNTIDLKNGRSCKNVF